MRRFTIETDGRCFDVVDEYGRRTSPSDYPGGLTLGEMIEQVLGLSGITRHTFDMRTDAQWVDHAARSEERRVQNRAREAARKDAEMAAAVEAEIARRTAPAWMVDQPGQD